MSKFPIERDRKKLIPYIKDALTVAPDFTFGHPRVASDLDEEYGTLTGAT